MTDKKRCGWVVVWTQFGAGQLGYWWNDTYAITRGNSIKAWESLVESWGWPESECGWKAQQRKGDFKCIPVYYNPEDVRK